MQNGLLKQQNKQTKRILEQPIRAEKSPPTAGRGGVTRLPQCECSAGSRTDTVSKPNGQVAPDRREQVDGFHTTVSTLGREVMNKKKKKSLHLKGTNPVLINKISHSHQDFRNQNKLKCTSNAPQAQRRVSNSIPALLLFQFHQQKYPGKSHFITWNNAARSCAFVSYLHGSKTTKLFY